MSAGGHTALSLAGGRWSRAGFTGIDAELLNDPPGFDRRQASAGIDRAVTHFFLRHLMP